MARKKETVSVVGSGNDDCMDGGTMNWVCERLPELERHAASLLPFNDVINEAYCGDDYFVIGIECSRGVFPSGDYENYGAKVYRDRVVMHHDLHSGGTVYRETYATDMAGLWSFLRNLPRPMASFGKWHPMEGE